VLFADCAVNPPCGSGFSAGQPSRARLETPLSWPAASATSNHRRLGTLLQLTVVSAVTITFALLTWNRRWGIDVGAPLAAQGRIGGKPVSVGSPA
jgi:hypothetical protein